MVDVFKQIFSGIYVIMSSIKIFGCSLWEISFGFTVLAVGIRALRSFFVAGGSGSEIGGDE